MHTSPDILLHIAKAEKSISLLYNVLISAAILILLFCMLLMLNWLRRRKALRKLRQSNPSATTTDIWSESAKRLEQAPSPTEPSENPSPLLYDDASGDTDTFNPLDHLDEQQEEQEEEDPADHWKKDTIYEDQDEVEYDAPHDYQDPEDDDDTDDDSQDEDKLQ